MQQISFPLFNIICSLKNKLNQFFNQLSEVSGQLIKEAGPVSCCPGGTQTRSLVAVVGQFGRPGAK